MELCSKYMERQTDQDFFWVVVDDVHDTIEPKRCDLFIRREPKWNPENGPTMLKNLAAAFHAIEGMDFDLILFIEDDDWYAPEYLATMKARLASQPQHIKLIGESHHHYFNVMLQVHMPNNNSIHAALCATGVRFSALDVCIKYCEENIYQFFDFWLWKKSGLPGTLFPGNLCVGIKALPGRTGIGLGHYAMFARKRCRPDLGLKILRSSIGDDADNYTGFAMKDLKSVHKQRFETVPNTAHIPAEWQPQHIKPIRTAGEIRPAIKRYTPSSGGGRVVKPIMTTGPIEKKKRKK